MQRWYAHSGVSIASELQLPEWSQCEQVSGLGEPDVRIRLELSARESETGTAPRSLITPDEYELRVPQVGHFRVTDGREIHIRPLATAVPAKVRAWLLGPVWGALGYQRGWFIAHASAVRVDDEAVIFCGRAGRGKSTLAVQLGTRGYPLVSDDLCRLDLPEHGPPVIYPSPPRVKLWSDTLGELGWSLGELAPDHFRDGKFHVSLTGPGSFQPLPVRGAYLLAWGEFGIRELRGISAFRSFLAEGTWHMRMLDAMGRASAHSSRCLEFLRCVPLAELTRPRDFPASVKILDFLAGRWSRAAV
jgi:hypothetical protein